MEPLRTYRVDFLTKGGHMKSGIVEAKDINEAMQIATSHYPDLVITGVVQTDTVILCKN
jgi:hypothetical protein